MSLSVEKKRERATERLAAAAKAMNTDEATAASSRTRWEREVLDAYENGLTYPEIAALSKKSRARIDQVLRAERRRRGIPINERSA